jgi:hypothetical protein
LASIPKTIAFHDVFGYKGNNISRDGGIRKIRALGWLMGSGCGT